MKKFILLTALSFLAAATPAAAQSKPAIILPRVPAPQPGAAEVEYLVNATTLRLVCRDAQVTVQTQGRILNMRQLTSFKTARGADVQLTVFCDGALGVAHFTADKSAELDFASDQGSSLFQIGKLPGLVLRPSSHGNSLETK